MTPRRDDDAATIHRNFIVAGPAHDKMISRRLTRCRRQSQDRDDDAGLITSARAQHGADSKKRPITATTNIGACARDMTPDDDFGDIGRRRSHDAFFQYTERRCLSAICADITWRWPRGETARRFRHAAAIRHRAGDTRRRSHDAHQSRQAAAGVPIRHGESCLVFMARRCRIRRFCCSAAARLRLDGPAERNAALRAMMAIAKFQMPTRYHLYQPSTCRAEHYFGRRIRQRFGALPQRPAALVDSAQAISIISKREPAARASSMASILPTPRRRSIRDLGSLSLAQSQRALRFH